MNTLTLDEARALDAGDPLRGFRDRFQLPEGVIYLDGNSLGALPKATPGRITEVVAQQWGGDLISSWNRHGWMNMPQKIGGLIAPLIGAKPNEVLATDSTSVNLYKLIAAALSLQHPRKVVLSEPGNFPTDLYVASGAVGMSADATLKTVPGDEIIDAIDEDVALVLLTHVHYKSGRMHDMAAITQAAHAKGALVLWDLSHSAGAVKVDLNGCDADLAVGCGYKYLNGGPGAPAFLYVAERLQERLQSPLTGWMGHAAPFEFGDDYAPAPGINRFLCGTPPILGLAALEVGLELFGEVDFKAITVKSQTLTTLFIDLIEARCGEHGFELVTPRDAAARGSHVSLAHREAYPICQALIERGVVGDFRAPDILRCGFTPLYTSYEDVWRAVDILSEIMETRAWDTDAYRARSAVT